MLPAQAPSGLSRQRALSILGQLVRVLEAAAARNRQELSSRLLVLGRIQLAEIAALVAERV